VKWWVLKQTAALGAGGRPRMMTVAFFTARQLDRKVRVDAGGLLI
jgi:hypothetical protein